ncbi:MAG: bifunctional 4-hydroxy-2-oxoglutarate aldolase/2-dehydro-3-deoxy-phosphogluconate aldolase [Leadbetterella sp.]
MSSKIEYILQNPLVPVFFHSDAEKSKEIVSNCYEAGIRIFEFTFRGKEAFEVFKTLRAHITENCPDMLLGIGTLVFRDDAQKFIDLGTDFIVQPGITEEVGKVCTNNNIPWVPGVMTPTEIYRALDLGASMVKIFPANILGSAYVKALRGPMPNVNIMVTGGIEPTVACVQEWISAGANALGLGSQLFKDSTIPLKETVQGLMSEIK